jgi:two-component system response regulator ResD
LNDKQNILIVDDEASVVEVVGLYLRREGFDIRSASDGREAFEELQKGRPDLLILDVMLPEIDGLEILRRLRSGSDAKVPVILLTARGQEVDRIYGLELGADDYVVKPFSPAELTARVKAVLRRTGTDQILPGAHQTVEFEGLRIDPKTREVIVQDNRVELTATEFNLLYFLTNHPRQVFSRDQLLEKVWGYSEYVDPSTVTVHIRRLREKIEIEPSDPTRLVTVWGVGYKFEPGDKS